MRRPNIEDYHKDKTGERLMNGPYNQTKYARDLNKYIDKLESNTLPSELMDRLLRLSKEYCTQDNRATAKPFFVQIQEQERVYDSGLNGHTKLLYNKDNTEDHYDTMEDLKHEFKDVPDVDDIDELYLYHDDWADDHNLEFTSYSMKSTYKNSFLTIKSCQDHIVL